MTVLQDHDLVMLDLDGVVYVGPDAVPGAVDAINAVDVPAVFLTNNASRTAGDVARHLRSLGLSLDDDAVVTAGQVVADLVRQELGEGAAVLVAGAEGMRRALEDAGLRIVTSAQDGPQAVVQGGVVDVRWSELAEASYAVAAGIPWFAANPDATFPTPRGLAPGNGAFVHAVQLATGGSPVVAGKPAVPIFDEARRRTGAHAPLMVGDRIDTDLDGAIAAGLDCMVVLTGVTSLADLAALPAGRRPTYVAADLGGLHVDHPPVEIVGVEARCGRATAVRVNADEIVVTGAATRSVEGLRAYLAIAWETMDA